MKPNWACKDYTDSHDWMNCNLCKKNRANLGLEFYRPEWACDNYGNYEHDWLDCDLCNKNYELYLMKSYLQCIDDLDGV